MKWLDDISDSGTGVISSRVGDGQECLEAWSMESQKVRTQSSKTELNWIKIIKCFSNF